MTEEFLIAWCTCPSAEVADTLSRALVERRLVACATALPGARSTYRWQGKVEQTNEIVLMLKTHADAWTALEIAISELHPYDVPELIATRIDAGSAAYLEWLAETTR